jgi:hypothetical protein
MLPSPIAARHRATSLLGRVVAGSNPARSQDR